MCGDERRAGSDSREARDLGIAADREEVRAGAGAIEQEPYGTARAIMMIVDTGTGPTPVAPMVWNSHGTAPALPWKFVLSTPCRISPTPSVAMKPLTLSTGHDRGRWPGRSLRRRRSVSVTAHGMFAALPFMVVAAIRLAQGS